MHRAIVSLMEELEAIDWYQQRADACKDPELRAILAHNRDEEKEHAAMVLEWIRRRDAVLSKELKDYLFTRQADHGRRRARLSRAARSRAWRSSGPHSRSFALTMLSVARLARMRFAAAAPGRVDPRYYKVFKGEGEPPELAAVSRNVINLYEMPTLFYAGTAIAFAAGQSGRAARRRSAGPTSRCACLHSAIHVTSNKVLWRFRAFCASWLVLLAYWAVLGVGLARAGG